MEQIDGITIFVVNLSLATFCCVHHFVGKIEQHMEIALKTSYNQGFLVPSTIFFFSIFSS